MFLCIIIIIIFFFLAMPHGMGAHLCMKYNLGISNFLEEISSLPHSVVFLYFLY